MKRHVFILSAIIFLSAQLIFSGCKKPKQDTTKPVITLVGAASTYWQQNKTYSDPGSAANDDTDGSVPVVTSGNVNPAVVGTYVINYSATDAAGNKATATRTVCVVNFDGKYDLIQTLCTDTSRNTVPTHPDSSIVNASLLSSYYQMNIGNFGRRTANNVLATFYGTTLTVPIQANSTGTTGDQIEGVASITGTGIGANKVKFTFQFKELNANDSILNQGTAVFTHR